MTTPCTKGARHKWQFVKNTTNGMSASRGGICFTLRGLYRCECGQTKLGTADHEASNPLNDFVAALAGEKTK